MDWRRSLRTNAWSIIKWAIGIPASLVVARLYEHWEPLVWSLIQGMPFPSGVSAFWGYFGLLLIAVASIVIGSDIATRLKPKWHTQFDELEKGLIEVITKRDSTFRDRVNKYVVLASEAEDQLGVRHDNFYVNPDLLDSPERDSAHLTDLASKLLQIVKAQKRMSQRAETVAATEMPNQTILTFWITSTTDWFEVGLQNGKLLDLEKWKVLDGAVETVIPRIDHFRVTHNKRLKIGIKTTWERQDSVVCWARKGDIGEIEMDAYVQRRLSRFLPFEHNVFVGAYSYSKSPKPYNEIVFSLHKV